MKINNQNARKLLILLLILPAGFLSRAQTTEPYSLERLVGTALKNNEEIKNGTLDITASEYQLKEAWSTLMPKVDVNGQYMYYTMVPTQYAPASAFGGPEGQYRNLTLSLPQTVNGNIQASVNIFNKVVFSGLKTAKVAEEVSKTRLEVTQEEVVYRVSATYFTMQVLADNLERLHENIVNLEKTVAMNEVLKENDIVSVNVHNRLLINLENLKNQYEAQRLNHHQYSTLLKYLTGLPAEDSLVLAPFNYSAVIEDMDAVRIHDRPDIRQQELNIKLSEYDKKNTIAGFYPTLVGGMTYGVTGYNNEFSPTHQVNNDWVNSQSFSLSLKIPVLDGLQKSYKVKQKQIAIEKNRNYLNMMKSNAEKEITDASDNYQTNALQVLNSKKSLDLAEALFAGAQAEFENGITSTTDLLNAQNDLSNARNNYSTALLNLKLAELSWKKATGNLLGEYHASTF